MDHFGHNDFRQLISERQGSCVSIYTATRRGGNAAEPGHWKHQIEGAVSLLVAKGARKEEAESIVAPALEFLKDRDF